MISAADKAELAALEQAMWHAETRYDREFQERHFAPEFMEFGRSGRIYDRGQSILQAGDPIEARLERIQLSALANDVVLITYDSVVMRGGNAEYAHRSSIWTHAAGTWQMRFHQGTPFAPGD